MKLESTCHSDLEAHNVGIREFPAQTVKKLRTYQGNSCEWVLTFSKSRSNNYPLHLGITSKVFELESWGCAQNEAF